MSRPAPNALATLGILCVLAGGGPAALAAAQSERTAAPAEGGVRLVRSTSGTRGAQQGTRFVIEDPRTVFSPDTDRQVIVYFEWEGRPGTHHCEARWKDPTGHVVLISPIDYPATTRRFGIFWTLTLPEQAARGLWALEAVVDGQPAGTHTFEVGTAAAVAAAPRRPILSSAEIYKLALSAMGTIEAIGRSGEKTALGPAVAFDADHVIVAFNAIDGAASLRVRTGVGRVIEAQTVAGWNRRQGWALVPVPGHGLARLTPSGTSLTIGDRAFAVHTDDEGGRVITEVGIVGEEQTAAPRLRLSEYLASGSPLLDDRGDLVGLVVARSSEEPAGPVRMSVNDSPVRIVGANLAIPAPRLPTKAEAPVTLAELARRGEFVTPLSADRRHVISGVFAGRIERRGAVPMPLDQRSSFSRKDGQVSVFVSWDPKEKKDALTWFEVYDAENKKLGKGDPSKMKLRPGTLVFSGWTMNVGTLPPGSYRVDLVVDDAPAWRGYLRITD
jgi:hypothetical protein